MQFLVGILLILSLTMLPAPDSTDPGATGRIGVQVGTEGTRVQWRYESDTNPKVIIEDGFQIRDK